MLARLLGCLIAVIAFADSASAYWKVDADIRYADSASYRYRHVVYRMEMVPDPVTGMPEEQWVKKVTGSVYDFDGWISTPEGPIAKYSHLGSHWLGDNAETDKIKVVIEIDITNDGIDSFEPIPNVEGSATWVPNS